MLHGIGFFITCLGDDELPAPQELVGLDPRLASVADYLDHGVIHERYRGMSWCRFACGEWHMGSCDLTDGVWLWPQGLSHYLRTHSVLLPEAFIDHALNGRRPVAASREDRVDLQVWTEWGKERRKDGLRAAIEAARREDDRLAAEARQLRIETLTATHGEGQKACIYARCGRSVLRGMVYCARHTPEMFVDWRFHTHSGSLLAQALKTPT